MSEEEKMKAFIRELFDIYYPDCGDIDGGELQDLAEKHGILVHEIRHEPTGTITTQDHHALLESRAFFSYYYKTHQASGITEPLNTMTGLEKTSMVQFLESLKVEDLYYRMLQPKEIGKTMAFPKEYVVLGNGRQQVKQYGNAVTPPAMEKLIKRCVATFQ